MCVDCVDTHLKVGGSDECTPRDDVGDCGPGHYSPRGGGGVDCVACDVGKYLDGTGERYGNRCAYCPASADGRNQSSPAGSALSGCWLTYHAMASPICSGVGLDGRNSTLTRVTTAEDCRRFANDSSTLTFNGDNEACADPPDCRCTRPRRGVSQIRRSEGS